MTFLKAGLSCLRPTSIGNVGRIAVSTAARAPDLGKGDAGGSAGRSPARRGQHPPHSTGWTQRGPKKIQDRPVRVISSASTTSLGRLVTEESGSGNRWEPVGGSLPETPPVARSAQKAFLRRPGREKGVLTGAAAALLI